MNISELIKVLEEKLKEHGDIPVVIYDTHANTSDVGEVYVNKYGHQWVAISTK